jgi:hypothetical protein
MCQIQRIGNHAKLLNLRGRFIDTRLCGTEKPTTYRWFQRYVDLRHRPPDP